jgi:hypothetical protein
MITIIRVFGVVSELPRVRAEGPVVLNNQLADAGPRLPPLERQRNPRVRCCDLVRRPWFSSLHLCIRRQAALPRS